MLLHRLLSLSKVYKVYGKVTVDGSEPPAPISSVEVFMGDYQYSELTNYNGDYEMELPEGTWTINFYKDDYEPATAEVTVGPDNPRVEQNMSMVWIQPPTPIDVTGYYDWYNKWSEEEDWQYASVLYINQTDSSLEGTMGFSGSISGSAVNLNTCFMPELCISLNGTVSGDEINGYEITGDVTGDYGEGWFLLVPSTLPFGRIDLDEGNINGVEISLHTDYGLGSSGELGSTSFELTYEDHELDVILWFNLSRVLEADTYYVADGEAWLDIRYLRNGQGLDEYYFAATKGTLNITYYDADGIDDDGIAGTFTMSNEDESDYLSGEFDVNFVELE